MQIVSTQSQIVEKVLHDKNGRLVRARFYVYESAGRVKARLLDIEYLEPYIQALKNSIFSLAGFIKEKVSKTINSFEKIFEFPQFAFEVLNFSGSKPRAPTFV